ncbi:hypothetical protein [Flavobacterium sp. FlaQc-48]|uniref:hypothetical protein n=1 Tax=Flavobacterium sp. FlaQc-48 TaxID=3374181 RepID=UPI003757E525
MTKVAQFVVIINDNVVWMEKKALEFYSDLLGQKELGEKFVAENLSHQKLFRIQNDFSVEMLMAYEGDNPLSFMKLNSSRLSNQNLGANKAIGAEHVVYSSPDDITVLFNRAQQVALQRKHDLIWVKVLEIDTVLIEVLQSLHYEEFSFEEPLANESDPKLIYFRKSVQ